MAEPTEPASARLPSLRRRILWRVLLPLALTWGIGSAAALGLAYLFTARAYDRALLDDAYALAANVGQSGGALVLNLSPHELGVLLFDQSEREFFAIVRADGSLVAGSPGLVPAPAAADEAFAFDDRRFRGVELRVATLRREAPQRHYVVVGQTTRSRSALLGRVLALSVAPQLLLLALLGLWLRRSVTRALDPLVELQAALGRRDSHDLAPLTLAPGTRDVARLAEAFDALLGRIGAGARAQREFAGNVAHELRTPLAGIRSLAEYGLAQRESAVWREQLQRIVASEQRASHLVDQLLALALADEAREGLQLQRVAIDELVQELLARTLPRAEAAGIDLGASGLERPLHARAHAALLEGILGNLIDNALRYGRPADGTTARVTVGIAREGAQVLITVSDNGPGMDEAQRSHVRGRRARGDAGVRHGSGSGLGLAIVARYVEVLGGRFELGAAPEGGLRASVWLQAA